MTHNGKPVRIKYESFPPGLRGVVKGLCSSDPAGYLVIIDNTRSPQQQRRALGHELAHIFMGHLDGTGTALEDAERQARANAWKYYRLYRQGRL